VLWRQNVAAELTSAVFTEDSSCVLALGKGIFKVGCYSGCSDDGEQQQQRSNSRTELSGATSAKLLPAVDAAQ
jgi:hypothetical protein